jgi:hypothetical protein
MAILKDICLTKYVQSTPYVKAIGGGLSYL